MQHSRRRVLAGVAAVCGTTVGCIERSNPGGTDDRTDSPTATPTDGTESSPSPDGSVTNTDSPPSHESAVNTPNPDHAVRIDNSHDTTHRVRVTVTRESGSLVHESVTEIAPDTRTTVYNTKRADPNGIEEFTVTGELDGETQSIDIATNACYGDAFVEITDDGSLYCYYAIC